VSTANVPPAAPWTPPSAWAELGQRLLKPKLLLICILDFLALLASFGYGRGIVAPDLASAIIVAAVGDALLMRYVHGRWCFPDGALLTGLIVGMILSPAEPWYVAAVTAEVAIFSKYVLRTRTANIFNPAALALVAAFFTFHSGQNWWGAMFWNARGGLVVLIATGALITARVNKVPALLSFLGGYFLLFTLAAFVGDPGRVAEIFRTPDLQAALFLGFFMVTDPPTSPARPRHQVQFGAIAAAASFAVFELWGAVYFLLAGLLVANAWAAWIKGSGRYR